MKKIPALLIFGPPGSGKGTVGVKLAATTKLKHLSTGDIFRGIAPSSESGKLIASYSSAGKLVPDSATAQIFERYIKGLIDTNKLNPDTDTLLLDGIPRTPDQVDLIQSVVDVKYVFVLEIKNDSTIVERLLNRAKIEGRKDDADESIIKNRLIEYRDKTALVLSKYDKNIIHYIDGDKTPDEVFLDTLSAFVSYNKNT
ncbi:MAG: nucleoside monophosphate kinase [Fibrobacter sp.]|jgi:adenylate kinase|nr:nucleoside monophosphate kinase [Fibrobacter sp.]